MTDVSVVEHEGFTVTSNSETEDEIRASLGTSKDDETSKAAATLGKKGGEAAAKVREAKADEKKPVKPIKDAKPAKAEPEEEADEAPEPEKAAKEPEAKKPEDEQQPEAPSKKGNPRHDPTARVAEATRQAAEHRRRAEAAEARVRELEAQATKPAETREQPQARASEQADDKEPKEEDFQTYGEFVKAQISYQAEKVADAKIQKTLERINQHQRAAAMEQAHNERVGKWSEALESAEAADPGFSDKLSDDVYNLPWAGPGPGEKYTSKHVVAQVILSRPESSAQVMLHLSEHPQELQRLSTLHPTEVGWELGRIAGSMGAATAGKPASPREPRVSRANPPVPPVAGAPLTAEQDIREITDFDRFATVRMAQMKAKRA